jgi:hypothetical protein
VPGGVRVRVMERVERIARRDLQVKALAGSGVTDRKLDLLDAGVPEEEDLRRPALTPGQLSRWCPELDGFL